MSDNEILAFGSHSMILQGGMSNIQFMQIVTEMDIDNRAIDFFSSF